MVDRQESDSALRRRESRFEELGPGHEDYSWFGYNVDRLRKWWRGKRVRKDAEELEEIQIWIRGGSMQRSKRNNEICTSKYTWYNFLVLATLLQFRRFSNAFYLLICVINSIGYFFPNLYTVSYVPWGTLMILLFVIAVTLIFEGSDDLARHRADSKTNNHKTTKVLQTENEFDDATWGCLQPGDVIRVKKGEYIPADLLLVGSALSNGVCYIETSGIDGETNLKSRHVAKDLLELDISAHELNGRIKCEEPNSYLQFSGSLALRGKGKGKTIGIEFDSILLRGSQLRNTAWVDGVVVYAGNETKLIMSNSETPSKFSRLDTTVNRMMGYLLLVYLVVVILADILLIYWVPSTTTLWYFRGLDSVNSFVLPGWLAYFLTFSGIFASMIPINMYVCLEIVNYMQAQYINWDLNMYDKISDTPALCRTGSLVAEIGQITHIFSDKTGTLTNNVMRLVSCSIENEIYGWKPPKPSTTLGDQFGAAQASYGALDQSSSSRSTERTSSQQDNGNKTGVESLCAPKESVQDMFKDLTTALVEKEATLRFVLCLALCHTVLIEKEDGKIQYNAEGPDEEALVNAAAAIGVRLTNTENWIYQVEFSSGLNGETKQKEFKVIGVNRFNSDRKRMSVIVQDTETNEYWMYAKGADSIMYELASSESFDKDRRALLDEDLTRFSLCGLRTLVIGGRLLEEKTVQEWLDAKEKSKEEIGHERKKWESKAAAIVEKGFHVFGATGIEDALQDGVPETVKMIREAGINLWVLTGDKVQTAINIALSARIIDSSMTRILLDEGSQSELLKKMKGILAALGGVSKELAGGDIAQGDNETSTGAISQRLQAPKRSSSSSQFSVDDESDEKTALLSNDIESGMTNIRGLDLSDAKAEKLIAERLALVISGHALQELLMKEDGSQETQQVFLELASRCSVVLGCRVSPKQKALVVGVVEKENNAKEYKQPVTLAIGDGANDVAMIQEARVGVGISGNEGLQAVNSSDFAIARFRYLRELLLVHGRWNYQRNAMLVKYVSYSWLVLIFMVFLYIFYSMVSGQSIYVNTYYVTLFAWVTNSVITAIAWFQKDISRDHVFQYPSVYHVGKDNIYMNGASILKMCARSLMHAVLVIGFVFYMLPDTVSLDTLGAAVFTGVFLLLFCRQILVTMNVNLFVTVCFILCAILFLVGVTLCDILEVLDGTGVPLLFSSSSAPLVWSRSFLAALAMVVVDYVALGIPKILYPSELRVVREMDRFPKLGMLQKENLHLSLEEDEIESGPRAVVGSLVRQASLHTPGMLPLMEHKGFAES